LSLSLVTNSCAMASFIATQTAGVLCSIAFLRLLISLPTVIDLVVPVERDEACEVTSHVDVPLGARLLS
jgi:hypothetical protein